MGGYRKNFIVSALLQALNLDVPLIPLQSAYEFLYAQKKVSRKRYRETLLRMKSRGVLDIVRKQGEEFIKLTKKGQLKTLLIKAAIHKTKNWDGKWRVLMYDIPESAHANRDRFRKFLRQNNFIKLQQSAFICPYPIDPIAIDFLNESKLIKYIRILQVSKLDNDAELKKKFKLQ